MIRTLLITILTLFLCVSAIAQKNKQSDDSKVERELMQLERDWSAAYLKHDTATIDRRLAEDYMGTDGRGWITNKAQEMKRLKNRERERRRPTLLCWMKPSLI